MKKMISAIAVTAMMATGANAWTNNHGGAGGNGGNGGAGGAGGSASANANSHSHSNSNANSNSNSSANQGQHQSTRNSNNSTYESTTNVSAPSVSGTNPCGLGFGAGIPGLEQISFGFTYAGRKCVVMREAELIHDLAGGGEAGRRAQIIHIYKNDARLRRTLIAAGIATPVED